MADLWRPLVQHVGQAVAVIDGETDYNDVSVGIRQRTKLFKVFLASRVPQRELNRLSINLAPTYCKIASRI